jgi:hypothetical protein
MHTKGTRAASHCLADVADTDHTQYALA